LVYYRFPSHAEHVSPPRLNAVCQRALVRVFIQHDTPPSQEALLLCLQLNQPIGVAAVEVCADALNGAALYHPTPPVLNIIAGAVLVVSQVCVRFVPNGFVTHSGLLVIEVSLFHVIELLEDSSHTIRKTGRLVKTSSHSMRRMLVVAVIAGATPLNDDRGAIGGNGGIAFSAMAVRSEQAQNNSSNTTSNAA
jgi:hypothetical protein